MRSRSISYPSDSGTLHGGVYDTFMGEAKCLSVSSLVGLRTATTHLSLHFGLPPLERTRLPYATLAFSILPSS